MSEFRSNADVVPCVSVVMPVYNEEATIKQIIELVLSQRPVMQLVAVDDCSKDGTWAALQTFAAEPRVKLVKHDVNQGKGAALRTGFQHASSPIVLIQDADLEYDPAEYYLLVAPI